jgi:hypothetical protein
MAQMRRRVTSTAHIDAVVALSYRASMREPKRGCTDNRTDAIWTLQVNVSNFFDMTFQKCHIRLDGAASWKREADSRNNSASMNHAQPKLPASTIYMTIVIVTPSTAERRPRVSDLTPPGPDLG